MSDMTAGKAKETARRDDKAAAFANEETALARRYGQIGILAVAAAVRYQGTAKNLAYAPVAIRLDYRIEDAA